MNNFNLQNFFVETLKALKPYYIFEYIYPQSKNSVKSKYFKNKIYFIPQDIRQISPDYYKKK